MNTPKHDAMRSAYLSLGKLGVLLLGGLALLSPGLTQAADATVCARVKIEIQQELTIERQAFDAMMRITNGIDTSPLENVDINVTFKDEAGNSIRATSDPNDTTASFFIRVDRMAGIDNVSGTGKVAASSVAEIHWLIIPGTGAGGTAPTGKLYYVGANLKYTVGGKDESVDVVPDFIYVKPLPILNLDYFLTKDVFGDDPLTSIIEPIEPYTLGVRIKNVGAAVAKNVKIESAQPKIVENTQGLLINFKIIGSYLNDLPASPSLLIPFGDIAANSAGSGRWLMTSTLSGKFVEFSASFTHADELGGALTSLIPADGIKTHFLIRDVKVDLPGRDNVRDFLAKDGDVYRTYESSGVDTVTTNQSGASVLTANGGSGGNALYALNTPATAGLMYVKLPDAFNGTKTLGTVTRVDGKTMASENVWLSKERDANNTLQYYFNLFDANTPGLYNISFQDLVSAPQAPVLAFIPDRTVTEGQQVSFVVEASDADGTRPAITTSLLPAGASFTTQNGAVNNLTLGVFDWTPSVGQAGSYPITYTASDGSLTSSATAIITVNPERTPGGPDVPRIKSPELATEVRLLQPTLIVTSANALDSATSYQFEVYADSAFTNLAVQNDNVPKAGAETAWKVSVPLLDNSHYYWRVRSFNGNTYSAWATGRFKVNLANDAPGAFALVSPANGVSVDSVSPSLVAQNSLDPDGDAVRYRFEVYADSGLSQAVASVQDVAAGANGTTAWVVSPALSDISAYSWRVIAVDSFGAQTASAVGNFLVDTRRPVPGVPAIVSPAVGGAVNASNTSLTIANSTKPEGMVVTYHFELDRVNTFNSVNKLVSGPRTEGAGGTTAFEVTGLVENAQYHWRAKASDGLSESAWVAGNFLVDAENDPPSVPVLKNPGDNSWQVTRMPLLEVNPSVDPEGDTLAYRFEIYTDSGLTNRVGERLSNSTTWLVDPALADDSRYYWRARAEDLRGGASAWSAAASFLVKTTLNNRPVVSLTAPASVVSVTGPSATITWEVEDPEHNTTLALYYDSDNQGADGTRIVDNLKQDPARTTGSYTWDLSALTPGTYYVYAVAVNTAGSTTRYAPGVFSIPVPQPRGGITVNAASNLQTTEAGGAASFTVVLTRSPISDVEIGLSVTHAAEARVAPATLRFTQANWNVPQSVTVTGLADCLPDGDVVYQVITAKAQSADPDYLDIKGSGVTLVNRDSQAGCPSNLPPTANAGPDQLAQAGASVLLIGSGTDTDGAISAYQWTQTAGPNVTLTDAKKATASFTAPFLAADTLLSFTLKVTDNEGATATDTVNITVRATPNLPPSANAGADQTVASGAAVTLNGSGHDSDGVVVAYAWTQIGGPPVTLTNASSATASFTAPTVVSNTVFGFQLKVTDDKSATGTAVVSITVLPPPPNNAPVANAGPDQSMDETALVTLVGSGSDSDGTITAYAWTQTAGPSVVLSAPNSATTTFTAPAVSVNTVLTFTLTVTDDKGATASDSVSITVIPNNPPTANAGPDQSEEERSSVTLSGSGSDTDGSIVAYAWTQTAGPSVVLSAPTSASTSFTAPAVEAITVLSFQLTVTDNKGETGSDSVNITVIPNNPPSANAGPDKTVNEGAAVALNGSGSDTDGSIVAYAWTQTSGPAVSLNNANSATATFTAPRVSGDTVFSFTLTVTDNKGKTGSDSAAITVLNDSTAPTLSVTLSPNTLWPPNGTLHDITATLSVDDNVDLQPEVKLESISANETLITGVDINGAQLGSDDRQFQLRAKRAGSNKAGRLYTVTYSATDRAGNKTTASATVWVPHDQGM